MSDNEKTNPSPGPEAPLPAAVVPTDAASASPTHSIGKDRSRESLEGANAEIIEGKIVEEPNGEEPFRGEANVSEQMLEGQIVEAAIVEVPQSVLVPEVAQRGSVPSDVTPSNQTGHNLVYRTSPSPPNFALMGSAVTSFVLGFWSILGATLTTYAMINGLLGVFLGVFGLASTRRKTAAVGLVLSFVGILLCLTNFFGWAAQLWETDTSPDFTGE